LEEIMGRGLVLDIFIKKAMGLSATRNASVQVSYQFFGDARPVRTEPPKDGINVELNHRRRIQINSVNSEFVKFIQEGVLKFDLWAAQKSTSPTENKSSRASFISMLPAATQDGAAELDALEDLIIKANGGSVDKSKDRTNGQRLSTVTEQAQQLIDRINALETSTCTLNADLAAAKMRERDAKQAMESMKKVSLPGSVDRPVSSSLVDVNTNLETAKLTIELKRKEDEVKRLEAELKVALETPKACCLIA
jgi:glycine cleavage system H lipoate-binding protein